MSFLWIFLTSELWIPSNLKFFIWIFRHEIFDGWESEGFVYFLTRFLSLLYEYLGQTHIIDVLMSFCESDKIENFSKRPKSESADE